jgi:serine/threonine protein kinase
MAVAQKKKLFDGRYEIVSIVGRGSRSVVYHARNTSDNNTEVALKVLVENKKDKISLTEKLRREALALVSSHHPSVIRLDDFHSVGEICYLAMEYAPESDVRKFAQKNNGKLSAHIVHDLLLQIADGLDYIHRTGIIHRDIKPDNLLVVSESQFRIGDFGVAFLPGDPADAKDLKNAVGTMDYMAPEVLEGVEYTQRSDIYSLGVTAYELLAGKNPFATISMVEQIETRKNLPSLISLFPDVPLYLSDIIAKACNFEAKDRFQSAREIVQSLKSKKTTTASTTTKAISPNRNQPKLTVVPGNQNPTTEIPKKNSQIELQEDATESKLLQDFVEKPVNPSQTPLSTESSDESEQISDKNMEGAIALKDSRHSRTPTVFISKESVAKVREDNLVDVKQPSQRKIKGAQSQIRRNGVPIFNISEEFVRISSGLSNSAILVIAFTVFFSTFLTIKLLRNNSSSENQMSVASNASGSLVEENGLVPTYNGTDLVFPALPTGVYSGSISGIIGSTPMPLTIISFANKGKLAVIVGADGFNPSVVEIQDKAETIKVIANGYIVELSGSSNNGIIEGTAKNLVSGTNGSFKLRPSST